MLYPDLTELAKCLESSRDGIFMGSVTEFVSEPVYGRKNIPPLRGYKHSLLHVL